MTEGEEAYNAINAAIEEMEVEIAAEFGVKTEKEIEREEAIEEAKKIIALAEKEGIENLMSASEVKVWRRNYNQVNNEGGEGYIPIRISKEQYTKALEVINK